MAETTQDVGISKEKVKKAEVGATNPVETTTHKQMMKTSTGDVNQLQRKYDSRERLAGRNIDNTLNAGLKAEQQGYKDAYDASLAGQQQAGANTQAAYDFARQDTGTQLNRTGTGMDQFADVRGLNRQEGSQQALNLNRNRQTVMGAQLAQQQAALAENQRQQDLLKMSYNGQVQNAIANRDYRKAAALLDEYKNQQQFMEASAQALAQYGNFAGMSALYGSQTAGSMRDLWISQNPDLAYNTGAITKKQYKAMTGRDTPDTKPKEGTFYGGGPGADWYTNGRPGWTVEHGGLGHGGGGGGGIPAGESTP